MYIRQQHDWQWCSDCLHESEKAFEKKHNIKPGGVWTFPSGLCILGQRDCLRHWILRKLKGWKTF